MSAWNNSKQEVLFLTFIAWLSIVGLDFFLHAGLLAELYSQPSPFLLSPLSSLAMIPVGYLALLLFAILLVWLMVRLKIAGWRQGAAFGFVLGGLTSAAFLLGLYSISTASPALLIAWFIASTLEMALAGAIVGSALAGMRLRRLFGIVLAFVVLSAVITILLQSFGVFHTAI